MSGVWMGGCIGVAVLVGMWVVVWGLCKLAQACDEAVEAMNEE